MNKFRMLFAILTVVALATSGYGFRITNVTNDEVVFNCTFEKGTPGENMQVDTPEIGTWDFRAFHLDPPELADSQDHNWVEDETTDIGRNDVTPFSPDYGNNFGRTETGGAPRPHAHSVFAETATAGQVGDLMRIECVFLSINGATSIRLNESPPDLVYLDPEYKSIASLTFIGDPGVGWGNPWDIPGALISQGAVAGEYNLTHYENVHTPGEWSEVLIEFVNGSTSAEVTVNGTLHTFNNMAPNILNHVAFASVATPGNAYMDALSAVIELLADFNNDGVIDDLDLTILATNWDTCGKDHSQGDANGDGCVDDLDLTALATEWPSGGLDVSAVPEPATLSLLAIGALAMFRRKRR